VLPGVLLGAHPGGNLWRWGGHARIAQDRRSPWAADGGIGVAKRIKSGLKHFRKSARRAQANLSVKSKVKSLVRTATTPEEIGVAQAALDKAAARKVIHPNTAARRKSRIMRRASGRAG